MRKIIHIDADCFFASVELKKHPRYKNMPVAVGGAPDSRGVVTTCNYIARAFGVRSAMSSAHAKRLCPDLHFFRPNMSAYKEASSEIFQILAGYSDVIEKVSIDEAFLDVTHSDAHRGSATLIAKDIQSKVVRELGFDISAGIAPNRYLAKIASDWNKPTGLFTVAPNDIDTFVKKLDLKRLPGVGPRAVEKLTRLGLVTCQDIRDCDPALLFRYFGSFSRSLVDMSWGRGSSVVGAERSSKSLSVEHTFDENVASASELLTRLPTLLARLRERYEASPHRYRPSKRVVKLKFADFSRTSIEAGIPSCEDTFSAEAFERFTYLARQRRAEPVRLLGVGLRFQGGSTVDQLELPFG